MTPHSAVHSNACNFMSFVQNSVDQRTGQYSLAIALPALLGNDLVGPDLPLRLSFNAFNDQDSGYGKGWRLALTQYVPSSKMLSLHSGESFKVTGSGALPSIREKKLDSFHFHDDSQGSDLRYRVVHKTGLVEVLTPHGTGSDQVALPTRVQAPTGHGLTLGYTDYQGSTCLESIVDDSGVPLLTITYALGQVTFDLRPGAGDRGEAYARYTLQLSNRELRKVILPGAEGANWRFDYITARALTCLAKVWTPTGAVETLEYTDEGHLLPGGGGRKALPRITGHIVSPGFDQPQLKTTYTYSSENFVGHDSGITWTDEGEDNLYRAPSSYQYSVTAHYWLGDRVVRTQTQTYNRFHLMIQQVLEQDGHIEETLTEFHGDTHVEFDQQPANFQLPRTITKQWKLRSDVSKLRSETATTRYDLHGNLIEEIQPTGIRTAYEYYPKEGEQGQGPACPADPEGFVRNLKHTTVYPVPGLEGDAPVIRTRLSYAAYPPLARAGTRPWLAVSQEQVLQIHGLDQEQEQLLQLTERRYLNTPDDAYLHGRADHQTTTLYTSCSSDPLRKAIDSRSARSELHYRKVEDPKRGLEHWTDETVTGFDLVQKRASQAVSPLHGQITFAQDDFGNSIRLDYDVLGRLVEEITAPDTADETRNHFGYTLVASPGDQATQWFSDSDAVVTYLNFDGCNRILTQELQLPADAPGHEPSARYLVAQTRYDGLGQVLDETAHDYHDERVVTLTSSFEYDNWGELTKTTLPNGATLHRERSPFGEQGDIVDSWMEAPDQPGVRQQHQVVESNRFDKPARQSRMDGTRTVGTRAFTYDGLGQAIGDAFSFDSPGKRPVKRTTGYRYDAWGRISQTERPDQSTVISEFAAHSSNALTERLLVKPKNAGQAIATWGRTFDGIERLSSLKVGLREETYEYEGDSALLKTRTTAAKRSFAYRYQPTLSSQPKSIQVASRKAEFDYDNTTAAIKSASNDQGTRTYAYTPLGHLLSARWQASSGIEYTCEYRSSLLGRPLGHSDSDGVAVSHEYDELGRVCKTRQGALQTSFTYDSAGRLATTLTQDDSNGQALHCEQRYDRLGREMRRCLVLSRGVQPVVTQVIEQTWRADDQLHTRTLTENGQLQLAETFDYDTLDRLEEHSCEGPALPRNAQGREIVRQTFVYDALDNLTDCITDFADGQTDEASFTYDGFLLRKAEHTLQPDYPARQLFTHDADGNLLNDEWGRRLVYDEAGRLVQVRSADDRQLLFSYRYDGHDELLGVRQGAEAEVQRRYQGYRLSTTLQDGALTQYLHAGDCPLGLQRSAGAGGNCLLLTNASNSVIAQSSATHLHPVQYSAYGESVEDSDLQCLLGFNGEAREHALGWYLLGRGYRAYNPGLMRFHSPDSMAPEQAGINPYVYCGGNPVNWRDPSGHMGERNSVEYPYVPPRPVKKPKADWKSWLGVAMGAVFAVIGLIMLPPLGMTVAFAMGVTSLALDVASTAVGAAALATGKEGLGNAAFWLGIGSALSTLGVIGYSRFATKTAIQGGKQGVSKATQTGRLAGTSSTRSSIVGSGARHTMLVSRDGNFTAMAKGRGIVAASKRGMYLPGHEDGFTAISTIATPASKTRTVVDAAVQVPPDNVKSDPGRWIAPSTPDVTVSEVVRHTSAPPPPPTGNPIPGGGLLGWGRDAHGNWTPGLSTKSFVPSSVQ